MSDPVSVVAGWLTKAPEPDEMDPVKVWLDQAEALRDTHPLTTAAMKRLVERMERACERLDAKIAADRWRQANDL
jgi:hypothetical protein